LLKVLQAQKALLNEGITLFNEKPSKGIRFLQDKGILKNPMEVDQVAAFLRASPKLDKAMYVSRL
jgi:Sec7-like guanine-nucleotide exchange factor